jgi:CRP-like cAMP-binding protein
MKSYDRSMNSLLTQVNLWQIFQSAVTTALPKQSDFQRIEQEKTYAPIEAVFTQGQAHPYLYVLKQGLIKLVYLDESGKEWIKSFIAEGQFFASLAALHPQGGTCSFSAVAMEHTVVEQMSYAALTGLATQHIEWANAAMNLTLYYARQKELREQALLSLTPEQRYVQFARERPALLKRLPQKELAIHLGVTPVGLNRIIKRQRARSESLA